MELHRMEALGRMAAGIAHDFRGIVGIAQGFAELIRRVPELPKQADHYAQRIIDALQRGQHLSQEISKFGKDDPVSPRVLDVAQTIATSTNMFKVLLGDSVRLKVVSDGPVSRVFMDPAQLERALLNLVLNARDAMPAGGELRISYKDAEIDDAHDESATYVAVSVSDNGSGMDDETRTNAFKPFYTTKGESGTGLGLAIVYQIISRAGGNVHIDTEAGRGTTVTMYLPRIAGAASLALRLCDGDVGVRHGMVGKCCAEALPFLVGFAILAIPAQLADVFQPTLRIGVDARLRRGRLGRRCFVLVGADSAAARHGVARSGARTRRCSWPAFACDDDVLKLLLRIVRLQSGFLFAGRHGGLCGRSRGLCRRERAL